MCESHAHMEAAGALEEIVDILEGIDWRHVEGMSPEEASALAGRLMDAQHQTNQAAGYLGEHREVAMDGGTSWSGLSALERDVILAVRRLNTQVVDTTGAAITRQVTHDPDAERSAKSVYLALDHLVTMGLLEREPLDGRASCYECTAEAVDIAHEHFEAGRELFSDGGDAIATIGGEGR